MLTFSQKRLRSWRADDGNASTGEKFKIHSDSRAGANMSYLSSPKHRHADEIAPSSHLSNAEKKAVAYIYALVLLSRHSSWRIYRRSL